MTWSTHGGTRSCGDDAAVDHEVVAGDVAGLVGQEERDRVGDLLGGARATQHDLPADGLGGVLGGDRVVVHVGLDVAGTDRVDADAPLGEVGRERLREVADRGLRGRVEACAGQPAMGGYQLMVAGDIFRGRYRESLETPKPLAPGKPLLYRFALPTSNHVFLPGHRIMVQVQSSWFPLYDRNPQTFVPNIFWAKPGDYRKATQRVYHTPKHSSFVELPVAGPDVGTRPRRVGNPPR